MIEYSINVQKMLIRIWILRVSAEPTSNSSPIQQKKNNKYCKYKFEVS